MEETKKLKVEIASVVNINAIGCVNVKDNNFVIFTANGTQLVGISGFVENSNTLFKKVVRFLNKFQTLPEKIKQKNQYMVIGKSPINGHDKQRIIVNLLSDIDVENSIYIK